MYRTYGKSSFLDVPHRLDKGDYKSSFITVGKIDNSDLGKYKESNKISFNKMILDFHFRTEKSKWDILLDIFNQEKSILKTKLDEWVANRLVPPIVEIANEPNLFPYLSPSLYSSYYKLWFDEIKSINPDTKIMNGGLWINEGLPKFIIKGLSVLNIKEVSASIYFKKVFDLLGEDYAPDILNLHFYPYIYKDSPLNMAGHIENLKKIIKESGIDEVWLTEFGNINCFSMESTRIIIDMILSELKKVNEIKHIYYYCTVDGDQKLDLLVEMNRIYNKNRNIFSKIFGGVFSIFKKNPMIDLTKEYIEHPPIQNLEDSNGLNVVGMAYKHYIDRYKIENK